MIIKVNSDEIKRKMAYRKEVGYTLQNAIMITILENVALRDAFFSSWREEVKDETKELSSKGS